MSGSSKKNKSGMLLFLAVFVGIAIIMFVANYKSDVLYELTTPSAGVERLSTYADQLIATSKDGDIYVWDWGKLPKLQLAGAVKSEKMVAMASDRVVWAPSGKSVLMVSNLKGDKQLGRLLLPIGKKCELLRASPNGKYAVAALTTDMDVEFVVMGPDLTSVSKVITKKTQGQLKVNDVGISNDGKLIVAAGRTSQGWILVADTQSKKILWEEAIAASNELKYVAFSPDGQMVYATISKRYINIFESATGKVIRQLEMDKYNTPSNNPQEISCITVSPDSRLLAVSCVPASKLWLWDAKTGVKIALIQPGQFTVTAVTFSPDSSLLAAGDLIGRNTMKVRRISK